MHTQKSLRRPRFLYFCHNTLQVPRVARQCMVALCEGAAEAGAASQIVSIALRPDPAEPRHRPFSELYGVQAPVDSVTYRLPGCAVGSDSRHVAALRFVTYALHMVRADTRRSLRHTGLAVLSARNTSVLAMLIVMRRLLYPRTVVLADVHGKPEGCLARWVCRNVDGNVCISRHLGDTLKAALALPDTRVRVAHTGVKAERFVRAEPKDAIVRRLGLDRGRPILCYAGKVQYRYEEVAYLIDVARRLRDEVSVVVVGGRPDQIPPWEAECRREGIRNVVFTGFKRPSDVPAYLHAADLAVMYYSPSALNDFRSPGKLFEYLASGTPLVAGRFCGIEEIVQDGENGFLVEPYRPDLLANRIRQLLANRASWEDVGRRAVATAQQYTWRHRASVFLEYARELKNAERAM